MPHAKTQSFSIRIATKTRLNNLSHAIRLCNIFFGSPQTISNWNIEC